MSKDAQQRENTFCANSGFKDVLKGGEQYIVAFCGACEVFLYVFVAYSFL